ncbi:MAG: TolB family protein [Bacillota bacterium]
MSGNSDKKDNVFQLDDLVKHMRQVRDSIPVNRKLRQELRARLIEGQKARTESPASILPEKSTSAGKRLPWRWVAGSLLVLSVFVAAFLAFRVPGQKTLDTGPVIEAARFWAEGGPLVPAVSPADGYIVLERGGALLLLNRQGSLFASVRPPAGQKYASPCWSPDGRKLALVRHKGDAAEIILLGIPPEVKPADLQQVIERGINEAAVLTGWPKAPRFTGLAWSPDGETLAYGLLENGESRVFLARGNKDVFLCPGAKPAWSPDGQRLVVEREENGYKTLRLVEKEGGRSYLLGQGSFPVWNKNGYLLFVKTSIREKILSYLPDGSPQFTVQWKTGEIRWLYLGGGEGSERGLPPEGEKLAGAALLMTPVSPAGPEELQWLKRLELSGVREPRTLFIDRSGDCEGLVSGDGMSLFLSRRDGGAVILTRIGLVENVVKREVGSK